jgi:adenine/guanine phosphoribosyltransferase-like PRPP-binding protein
MSPDWSGSWVSARLGVALEDVDRPVGVGLAELLGLAVRRNPRRAHLLVSAVLGKHVPADPRLVRGAGLLLGERVRAVLTAAVAMPPGEPATPTGERGSDAAGRAEVFGGRLAEALKGNAHAAVGLRDGLLARGPDLEAVVLGYAETATALGHCVADALGAAYYLHSTRRPVRGVSAYGGFEEEHSHATSHLMLPADSARMDADLPLVLVDDELSTGTTVLNTIRSLHAVRPRAHYVVAALVDLRGPADRAAMELLAAELDVRIEAVALTTGRVVLPEGLLETARRLVASTEATHAPTAAPPPGIAPDGATGGRPRTTARSRPGEGAVRRVELGWPAGLPDGGRHGFTAAHAEVLEAALPAMAVRIADALGTAMAHGPSAGPAVPRTGALNPSAGSAGGRSAPGSRVLVLGFEELMYVPLRLAEALADRLDDVEVRSSTTTRSPVLPVDDPGYAIRTRLTFPAHDDPADGPGERYAYNVAPGTDPARRFDAIVLVLDDAADTGELAAGLLARLTALGAPVLLATVPAYVPVPAHHPRRDGGEIRRAGRDDGEGQAREAGRTPGADRMGKAR